MYVKERQKNGIHQKGKNHTTDAEEYSISKCSSKCTKKNIRKKGFTENGKKKSNYNFHLKLTITYLKGLFRKGAK